LLCGSSTLLRSLASRGFASTEDRTSKLCSFIHSHSLAAAFVIVLLAGRFHLADNADPVTYLAAAASMFITSVTSLLPMNLIFGPKRHHATIADTRSRLSGGALASSILTTISSFGASVVLCLPTRGKNYLLSGRGAVARLRARNAVELLFFECPKWDRRGGFKHLFERHRRYLHP
jgi:hypothetical protein